MDGLHTELALGLIGELDTAPFVAKTYQMVSDPRTEALVRWGRDSNSFVVTDVAGFSELLLPCFFKHGNFSSFVRQLNSYGFRKVHPDRWEFAHESFLRGQTHLLPLIVRRKKKRGETSCSSLVGGGEQHVMANIGEEVEEEEDDEGREALLEEVRRLRQEQTAIGEQLAQMARRLQATERRSDRLMPFLARLDEDPNATSLHLLQQAAEKKLQRMQLPSRDFASFPIAPPLHPAPSPLLALGDAAMDGARVGQWAEPMPLKLPAFEEPSARSGVQQVPEFEGGGRDSGSGMGITDSGTAVEIPFPFCLLGQCFF
ncbi:heat stress transcription factor C-1a-like [Triticum urartu]|uniref:HSF-type DNA-binding domain-containing protein n=1 Tax=Triticum urartu TaxID=4572 RepID=A0A8R7PVP5_TRIUA|nr:heat stress transcription factor C-1a-like [Triticum urartu]